MRMGCPKKKPKAERPVRNLNRGGKPISGPGRGGRGLHRLLAGFRGGQAADRKKAQGGVAILYGGKNFGRELNSLSLKIPGQRK